MHSKVLCSSWQYSRWYLRFYCVTWEQWDFMKRGFDETEAPRYKCNPLPWKQQLFCLCFDWSFDPCKNRSLEDFWYLLWGQSVNSVFLSSLQFACCGVNGPEDFEAVPPLSHLPLEETTPEACCQRKLQSREGMFVNRKACLEGDERFQNRQVRAARWLEKRLPSRDGCGSRGLPTREGGRLCHSDCSWVCNYTYTVNKFWSRGYVIL